MRRQRTDVAFWQTRRAYSPPMPNHLVRKSDPVPTRYNLHEVGLDSFWLRFSRQAESLSQAHDMGAHHHALGDTKSRAQYHVGSLACHAGQLQELVHGVRNRSVPALDQGARGKNQALRLVAEESGRPDQVFDLASFGARHGCRGREADKERGCDEVDALISALGRQDGRAEKLEGVLAVEGAVRGRIGAMQYALDSLYPLSFLGGRGADGCDGAPSERLALGGWAGMVRSILSSVLLILIHGV